MTLRAFSAELLSVRLMDLVEELRDRDFTLTVRHYVLLHDLLMVVIAERGLDVELSTLRTLFAPVLCTSPYEQSRFVGIFSEWVQRIEQESAQARDVVIRPGYERRHRIDSDSSEQIGRELDAVADKAKTARRLVVLVAVGLVAIVLAVVAYHYLYG